MCYSINEIGEAIKDWKFALYEWDLNEEFETEIKDKFSATIRCIPSEGQYTDDLLTLKDKNNVKVIVWRNF